MLAQKCFLGHHEDMAKLLALGALLLVGCPDGECVAWRVETRQECTGYKVGNVIMSTCRPVDVNVCAAYERRVEQ